MLGGMGIKGLLGVVVNASVVKYERWVNGLGEDSL